MSVHAVIFDLDGVLIDSEPVWEDVRRRYVAEHGRAYPPDATRAIMGMSAPEWSRYLHDDLGVPVEPKQISIDVVRRVAAAYRAHFPIIPGAVDAVRRIARCVPVAIASSSNRELIELAVELAGLQGTFEALVSADDVKRGKPAPDVYVRAAERLGVVATSCGAVEDSSNGIRAAHASGAFTIAIPNRAYPPDPGALALADTILTSIAQLEPATFGIVDIP